MMSFHESAIEIKWTLTPLDLDPMNVQKQKYQLDMNFFHMFEACLQLNVNQSVGNIRKILNFEL